MPRSAAALTEYGALIASEVLAVSYTRAGPATRPAATRRSGSTPRMIWG